MKKFPLIIIYILFSVCNGDASQRNLGVLFKELVSTAAATRLINPSYSQAHVKLLSDKRYSRQKQ